MVYAITGNQVALENARKHLDGNWMHASFCAGMGDRDIGHGPVNPRKRLDGVVSRPSLPVLCGLPVVPAGAVTNVVSQSSLLVEIGKLLDVAEVKAVTSKSLHDLGLDTHGPVVSVSIDDSVWAAVKVRTAPLSCPAL